MPSPRATLILLALLVALMLTGCGAGVTGIASSSPEERAQLIREVKENADPAEIAYLREHREELEGAAEEAEGERAPEVLESEAGTSSAEAEGEEEGQEAGEEEG